MTNRWRTNPPSHQHIHRILRNGNRGRKARPGFERERSINHSQATDEPGNQAHGDRTVTTHKYLSGRTQFRRSKLQARNTPNCLNQTKMAHGGNKTHSRFNTYMHIHGNAVIQSCVRSGSSRSTNALPINIQLSVTTYTAAKRTYMLH